MVMDRKQELRGVLTRLILLEGNEAADPKLKLDQR